MGISVAMTLLLLGIQRYVRRMTGSAAIEADAMHYRTDLAINLGVAAAIAAAAWPGGWLADPLVAAAVIAYLLFGVWKIAKHALDILMDREIPDEDRETIIRLAESHPSGAGRSRSEDPPRRLELHRAVPRTAGRGPEPGRRTRNT